MYEYTATHFHDMEEAAAHYVSVSRSLLRDLQLVYEKFWQNFISVSPNFKVRIDINDILSAVYEAVGTTNKEKN